MSAKAVKGAASVGEAAGSAAKAAAAAGAAAGKAAKSAAGAAATAAKSAAKAAGDAASSAAAAAKRAAGGAADAGKAAGKSADSAADIAKGGKKVAKKADSAADIAKGGKKVAKKADSAADIAKGGKKVAKKSRSLTDVAPLLAAAGLIGGVMYIEKKLGDESEAVQGCATTCLPSNYDDLLYGDMTKDKLKYKTLEELKATDPEVPDDQPFCTDKIEDCGKFCTDKCKEKHQSDIPGSNILNRGADAAGNVAGNVFTKLNETLNPFAGPEGKKRMIIAGVILFLILFGPLIFKMMF
jgi:hypothetical protein